jgi:hypothetical protein
MLDLEVILIFMFSAMQYKWQFDSQPDDETVASMGVVWM